LSWAVQPTFADFFGRQKQLLGQAQKAAAAVLKMRGIKCVAWSELMEKLQVKKEAQAQKGLNLIRFCG
jgi:hypothetical protein